ncbi:MAG: glycoside hydrolase family 5 protein [Planctomycetota bacterium]
MAFWNKQRKGANGGGGRKLETWFQAAADFEIEFVRLSPATWKSAGRDFLLGDADHFTQIESADLDKLKKALDIAHRQNVRIILTMFSLPGVRWRQHNDNKFDYRLWCYERYQQQALTFWSQLAQQLKDHPAIVAYNPLNEPHPARRDGFESGQTKGFEEWLQKHRGTTSDLNRFNRRIIEAIRKVDPQTPIILDGWFHASPEGLSFLEPIEDKAVLYAFHSYGPWNYTTWRVNKERYSYPEKMPAGSNKNIVAWTIDDLRFHNVLPVAQWAKRHGIPASQIIVGEFGCDRRVDGAREYLRDLITIFNEQHWHWAFYSFRASDWDGMDYELGTDNLGRKYWQGREEGKHHEELIRRHDNPLWDIFKNEFIRQ